MTAKAIRHSHQDCIGSVSFAKKSSQGLLQGQVAGQLLQHHSAAVISCVKAEGGGGTGWAPGDSGMRPLGLGTLVLSCFSSPPSWDSELPTLLPTASCQCSK